MKDVFDEAIVAALVAVSGLRALVQIMEDAEAGPKMINMYFERGESRRRFTTCGLDRTFALCGIKDSFWGYRPSYSANLAFAILFAISMIAFLAQGFLSKRWWGFTFAMVFGCALELLSSSEQDVRDPVPGNNLRFFTAKEQLAAPAFRQCLLAGPKDIGLVHKPRWQVRKIELILRQFDLTDDSSDAPHKTPHNFRVMRRAGSSRRSVQLQTWYVCWLKRMDLMLESAKMALKRPLYGDLHAARAGIFQRDAANLDLPSPPTPTAISPNSSAYTSPP
ncbi:hypothetical protein NX059_010626 [Plenodomus lindquistii]|nr:hypothetical protein NX059_010626 [Plenodomus lindquistii]